MARSSLRTGAVVVVAYVVVAGLTTWWSPGAMRPLFDGFGSHPGQYNWVNPPKEFAEGNQRPDAAQAGIKFDAEESSAAGASTQDGQVLASVVEGALPPHPPDSSARIDVRPFDGASVAPLPAGLRAEGNAYRINLVYLPSRAPVPALTKPGTVGLTSVAPAHILLFSADGKGWERRPGNPLSKGTGLTALLHQSGYYLAASEGDPRPAATDSSNKPPLVVYVLAAAVPVMLGYFLLGRRSSSSRSAPRRPSGGRAASANSRRRPPAKASRAKRRKTPSSPSR